MMNANQLRSSFLDFFASRDHQLVASASLVPGTRRSCSPSPG